jgi:hypothetical protein
MRRGVVVLAVFLLIAAVPLPTSAGTATDPEIKDKAGDGSDKGRDIVSIWCEPGADGKSVSISIETATTPVASDPANHVLQERWTLWFVPSKGLPAGAKAAYVTFRYGIGTASSTGSPVLTAYFGTTTSAGTYGDVTAENSAPNVLAGPALKGKVFNVALPLAILKGFTLGTDTFSKMYGNVHRVSKGPVSGDPPKVDVNIIHTTYDRAPDKDFGRDFGAAPVAAVAVDFTLGGAQNVTIAAGSTKNVSLELMNKGAPTNISLAANASSAKVTARLGNATVRLASNATVKVPLEIHASASSPNQTTINVTASAGNVTRTLRIRVTLTPSGSSNGTSSNATSSESAAGAKTAKENGIPSPAIGATLLAVALAAAGSRRRRN